MSTLPLVCLYGGSFDPVHNAHLHILRYVNETLKPRTLCVIPCHQPPHKAGLYASNDDRLAMLRLALDELPKAIIDERELQRDTLSYTYDTVCEYRREHGGKVSLCFIIGGDSWLDFTSWHRWQEILAYVNLLVLKRPNSVQKEGLEASHRELNAYFNEHKIAAADLQYFPCGKVAMLENAELDIASKKIRELLRTGSSEFNSYLPRSVVQYINSRGLYRSNSTSMLTQY